LRKYSRFEFLGCYIRGAHLSATSSQHSADRVPLLDRARSSFTRRVMSPTRGTEASSRWPMASPSSARALATIRPTMAGHDLHNRGVRLPRSGIAITLLALLPSCLAIVTSATENQRNRGREKEVRSRARFSGDYRVPPSLGAEKLAGRIIRTLAGHSLPQRAIVCSRIARRNGRSPP
jgi:hypothetical protein